MSVNAVKIVAGAVSLLCVLFIIVAILDPTAANGIRAGCSYLLIKCIDEVWHGLDAPTDYFK